MHKKPDYGITVPPSGKSLSQHLYVHQSEALWTASFWIFMENSFIDPITD